MRAQSIELHLDPNVTGDLLVFERSMQDPLFDVNYGAVVLSDAYIPPDVATQYGTVASNAQTGLRYISSTGEVLTAEIFDPSDGERLNGEREIYPHDGENRPFTVDGQGKIPLKDMALIGMVWYVNGRRKR